MKENTKLPRARFSSTFFLLSYLLARRLPIPAVSRAVLFPCFPVSRLISRRVSPILSRARPSLPVLFYLFAFARRSWLNTVIYILSGNRMPRSVKRKTTKKSRPERPSPRSLTGTRTRKMERLPSPSRRATPLSGNITSNA